jgi:hypothetical protein
MTKAGELKYPKGGGAQPRGAKAERWNDAQFVQLELTDEQAKQLKATQVSADEIFAQMEKMIDDGYKFTIKYDAYGDCAGVWCQAATDECANSGYILTGRGSSALKALKQLLYKHFVLLEGSWAAHARRANSAVLDD